MYTPATLGLLTASPLGPSFAAEAAVANLERLRWLTLFDEFDAILALATPCAAPLLGQDTFVANGTTVWATRGATSSRHGAAMIGPHWFGIELNSYPSR